MISGFIRPIFFKIMCIHRHRRKRAGGRKQLEMELFEMKQELGFLSEVLEAQDSPTQRDKDKDELYNFKILF